MIKEVLSIPIFFVLKFESFSLKQKLKFLFQLDLMLNPLDLISHLEILFLPASFPSSVNLISNSEIFCSTFITLAMQWKIQKV